MMSDDDTELLSRALPLENLGGDLNLAIPPTSGQEYLRRVQIEAKKCPAVVVADLDTSTYREKQTFKVNPVAGHHPAPNGYSPSLGWQREQVAKFSEIRQKFSKRKPEIMEIRKQKDGQKKKKLPDKNDVQGWCHLCFGNFQSRPLPLSLQLAADVPTDTRTDAQTDTQTADSQDEDHLSSCESHENGYRGKPPLLSIVTKMDQPTVIQVLEYHVNWFEATGFTTQQGQWFYALLTCLEKPLDPETCSLIRTLAKNCASMRASLETPSDPLLAPLNLLICLVARYFDQTDLADSR